MAGWCRTGIVPSAASGPAARGSRLGSQVASVPAGLVAAHQGRRTWGWRWPAVVVVAVGVAVVAAGAGAGAARVADAGAARPAATVGHVLRHPGPWLPAAAAAADASAAA